MKRLFTLGIVGLTLFELANVYFIMPLPGSQRMRSIDAAYFLYGWRWTIRALLGAAILAGIPGVWNATGWRRWRVPILLAIGAAVVYVTNFRMAADHMFRQPTRLVMQPAGQNHVALDRLVVGIDVNGDARAYPLQFIGYHHQVRDTAGGREVLVSYCTVCRTGRVFSPVVNGRSQIFRLVGMDHWNAMFEDRETGSWWRQANGEAVEGPRKGQALLELPSRQVTLKQWLALHPKSLIMQGDPTFRDEYAKDYAFEKGTSRKELTGTDTSSWNDKSWVIGISLNGRSKAYDWNRLKKERVINDAVGGAPIVLVLGADSASYFAFERPNASTTFALQGDSLASAAGTFALTGSGPGGTLKPVRASQEFWHSWRTFQASTERY